MSSEPSISISIRSSKPIRRLLSRRLSVTEDPSMILSRVAMRYDEICDACVPSELTAQHWAMIFEALVGVPATDRADVVTVSRRINGGINGLSDRIRFYDRARLVLGVGQGKPRP